MIHSALKFQFLAIESPVELQTNSQARIVEIRSQRHRSGIKRRSSLQNSQLMMFAETQYLAIAAAFHVAVLRTLNLLATHDFINSDFVRQQTRALSWILSFGRNAQRRACNPPVNMQSAQRVLIYPSRRRTSSGERTGTPRQFIKQSRRHAPAANPPVVCRCLAAAAERTNAPCAFSLGGA